MGVGSEEKENTTTVTEVLDESTIVPSFVLEI